MQNYFFLTRKVFIIFINSISEWIRNNGDKILKVLDIPDHLGYNADYLSRLFKKHYNISLKEYTDKVKIQEIKNMLLNSNQTLKEVAENCGFNDYKYFPKFFKYHEGMTPTEFYNTYSKIHINNK